MSRELLVKQKRPGASQRPRICSEVEPMEHIIIKFGSPEIIAAWEPASNFIETPTGAILEISYPAILGNALFCSAGTTEKVRAATD
jgi:hypothetical protein